MTEHMALVLHEQPDGSYKSDPVKAAGVYRWAILTRGFGEEVVWGICQLYVGEIKTFPPLSDVRFGQ